MDTKKAPGEDGITGEVYQSAFEIFPRFITAMYNGCLRRGVFPKRWKTANLIPIAKPGKENSDEVSKFRPISLLNTGGKVLEKLLINSINSPCFLSRPHEQKPIRLQPQRSTTDAAMPVKGFIGPELESRVVILTSLDVKGA